MNILQLRKAITSSPKWDTDECENLLGALGTSKTEVQQGRVKRPLLEVIAEKLGVDLNAEPEPDRLTLLEHAIMRIESALSSLAPPAKAVVASMVEAARSIGAAECAPTPAEAWLARYIMPGNESGNCALLIGGSGTGKSWAAERHGRFFQFAPPPFACSPSTERWQLCGAMLPTAEGLQWVDGPLTEAARRAARGETVLFTLDEFPRLPLSIQMSFLTFLTKAQGRGEFEGQTVFWLDTERPVKNEHGDYVTEKLQVPVSRFCLVGTGNIGDAFGVPSGGIDEAVFKRFIHQRINWNKGAAKTIFSNALAAKIPSLNTKGKIKFASDLLLSLVEETRAMKLSDDSLAYPSCVRTVTRCIANCDGSMESLAFELTQMVNESLAAWERDGELSKTSRDAVKAKITPVINALTTGMEAADAKAAKEI